MFVIQNFPPERVRMTSSFFSSLVSRGSVLFLVSRDVPGNGDPLAAVRSGSSPSFQIFLHRLQRQVLRSGYTISLEQKGQFCIVLSSRHGYVFTGSLLYFTCLTQLAAFWSYIVDIFLFSWREIFTQIVPDRWNVSEFFKHNRWSISIQGIFIVIYTGLR